MTATPAATTTNVPLAMPQRTSDNLISTAPAASLSSATTKALKLLLISARMAASAVLRAHGALFAKTAI